MRKIVVVLGLMAATLAFSRVPAELRGEELMKALQGGGYTVILRHARTDRSFQEVMGTVPVERYDQRNLSDDGVKDARLMGVVFRKYGIKFAEIVSSPMFRTKETAEYAAGKPTQLTMALRVIPPTAEQGEILKAKPAPGTNRLIVTHHFVIELGVPGIKPGDIDESEAAVVKPTADGGIELVGKIKLADWAALAGPQTNATTSSVAVTHGGGGTPADFLTKGYVAGAALPNTPAGHLADAYLRAFNSGDTVQMKTAIESYLEVDASRPTAARLQSFVRLFEQFGPLQVTGLDNTDPSQLIVFAHAKGGGVRMTVKPSATQHMRAASIAFAYMQAQRP